MRGIALLSVVVVGLAATGAGAAPAPARSAPSAAQAQAARGSNAFAVDLYRALGARPGNVFFSPINIATAFGMAQAGARGRTAGEMRQVLRQTLPAAQVDAAMGGLMRDLSAEGADGARLSFANAVWLDKRFALKPGYQRTLAGDYGADAPRLDMTGDPSGSRAVINRWVEAKTANKIKDLLRNPLQGPMVITSAVYMKADWATPFEKRRTEDGAFYPGGGAAVRSAPLMQGEARVRYLDGGTFQAAALPYRGGRLSMAILLPRREDGLAAMERGMSAATLEGWLKRLDASLPQAVALSVPRFRLDDRFELKPLLQGLGMRAAFTDAADFSGVSAAPLTIAAAVHQAFLSVDETGSEAAAATALSMVMTSAMASQPPVVFRADHPFLFVIRDAPTGAIVFMGRLTTP